MEHLAPVLLLVSHLFFTPDGVLDHVIQTNEVIDLPIPHKDIVQGGNNNYACTRVGEKLDESAKPNEAYVWQCVDAKIEQPKVTE